MSGDYGLSRQVLRQIAWFSVVGMVATALALLIGIPVALWWLVQHVRFV